MLLFTHEDCLKHQPGAGHPEAAFRLRAALDAARQEGLVAREAAEVSAELARLAHSDAWIARLFAQCEAESILRVDADTVCAPGSARAARLAAGSVVNAVDAVVQGGMAFCAVRPPGHHATREHAMGFCLLNSIAIGAYRALELGVPRISIVDFDVHHGNGTQDIFFHDARVQYLSSHQAPLYPGTGASHERGDFGQIVNAQLTPGSGSVEFRRSYAEHLLPALDAFKPELIMISAGFDAHFLDPLAGLNVSAADYHWLSTELSLRAQKFASGRIVSALEGGYSATALRACTQAHLQGLKQLPFSPTFPEHP